MAADGDKVSQQLGMDSDDASSCYDEFEYDNNTSTMGLPSLVSRPAVESSEPKPVTYHRFSHAFHRRADTNKGYKRGHPRKASEMPAPSDSGMQPWMPPAARKRLLGAGAAPTPRGSNMKSQVPPRMSSLRATPGNSSFYHAALRESELLRDDDDLLVPSDEEGLAHGREPNYTQDPDFSPDLTPDHDQEHNHNDNPADWPSSLRDLVDETKRFIDAADPDTVDNMSGRGYRPTPEDLIFGSIPGDDRRLAPSPLLLRRHRSSQIYDTQQEQQQMLQQQQQQQHSRHPHHNYHNYHHNELPMTPPPRRKAGHTRSATVDSGASRIDVSMLAAAPGRPRGGSSPTPSQRPRHQRGESIVSMALPTPPIASPAAAPSPTPAPPSPPSKASKTQSMTPGSLINMVQKHTASRLRRPSRASKWAMPENMSDLLNGKAFKRSGEVEELLTPKQTELLNIRRTLAQRPIETTSRMGQRTAHRATPDPDQAFVQETLAQESRRRHHHHHSHHQRPAPIVEVDTAAREFQSPEPFELPAELPAELPVTLTSSRSESSLQSPPLPPPKNPRRFNRDSIKELPALPALPTPPPMPDSPPGLMSSSETPSPVSIASEYREDHGDERSLHLVSTPFSALTPGFRHGSIALPKRTKKEAVLTSSIPGFGTPALGLGSIEEKPEWTAFQMAMLGSWDLEPLRPETDEVDGKLVGDLAEWMDDLGFETHGELVGETQQTQTPDRRSQTTVSSADSSIESGEVKEYDAPRLSLSGNHEGSGGEYAQWPGEEKAHGELRVVDHDVPEMGYYGYE